MGKIILLAAALVALAMAAVFGKIGLDGRRDASRFSRLEPLDGARFAGTAEAGATGYVEGSIAHDQPVLKHGLVLYSRSRLSGFRRDAGTREPTWRSLDANRPALEITVAEVAMTEGAITGPKRDPARGIEVFGDYRVTFRGSDPIRLSTADLEVGVTERFEGLEPGQAVVAVGIVARRPGGHSPGEHSPGEHSPGGHSPGNWGLGLDTELLSSGTYEDLIAGERASGRFGLIAGAALLVVAIVLVSIAIATA